MRTTKSAYMSLVYIIPLPVIFALLLNYSNTSNSESSSTYILQVILYFFCYMIPDILLYSDGYKPRGLSRARQIARNGSGVIGLIALAKYPSSLETFSELLYDQSVLILISALIATGLIFQLRSFFSKKTALLKILKAALPPVIASLFFTALNFSFGLTPAQILCTFPIALGVLINLHCPGNKKLAVRRKQATPTARAIGSLLESLSFCSGITVLLTISPLGTVLSMGGFLTVFFLLFAIHWAATYHRIVRLD